MRYNGLTTMAIVKASQASSGIVEEVVSAPSFIMPARAEATRVSLCNAAPTGSAAYLNPGRKQPIFSTGVIAGLLERFFPPFQCVYFQVVVSGSASRIILTSLPISPVIGGNLSLGIAGTAEFLCIRGMMDESGDGWLSRVEKADSVDCMWRTAAAEAIYRRRFFIPDEWLPVISPSLGVHVRCCK